MKVVSENLNFMGGKRIPPCVQFFICLELLQPCKRWLGQQRVENDTLLFGSFILFFDFDLSGKIIFPSEHSEALFWIETRHDWVPVDLPQLPVIVFFASKTN